MRRSMMSIAALTTTALLSVGCTADGHRAADVTTESAPDAAAPSPMPVAFTPDGIYRAVHSVPDCPDLIPTPGEEHRLDEIHIDGDELTFYYYADHDGLEPTTQRVFDWKDPIEVYRDKMMLTHDAEVEVTVSWELANDQLVMREPQGNCVTGWLMTSKPWTRVSP
jgi:hypothetical protein